MPGSSNFLVFNPTDVVNTDSDVAYAAQTQRADGIATGVAIKSMHNKLFRQVSVMVAAIAQFMADQGETVSDSDLAALVTVIESAIETPDGAQGKVNTHASNTLNPHEVTAAQVGAIPTTHEFFKTGSFLDTTTMMLAGAEYTKTIPHGLAGANRGRCTIDGYSGSKAIVFFDTDITHAYSVETSALGFTMVRGDGSLMFSLGDIDAVMLEHCYISGENIVMVFRNETEYYRILNVENCLWEVNA